VILSQSDIKILKWYKAMGVDEIHSNTTRAYIKKNPSENPSENPSPVKPSLRLSFRQNKKNYVENRKTLSRLAVPLLPKPQNQVAEVAVKKNQIPNNLLDASVLLELTDSEIYSYACKIKDNSI
jgi:hypothetical protein